MKKEFGVHYYDDPTGEERKLSHTYFETWEFLEEIYCPNCGNKGVWASDGYDYYVDNEHICVECGYLFHLPCSGKIGNDELGIQRLQHLKSLAEEIMDEIISFEDLPEKFQTFVCDQYREYARIMKDSGWESQEFGEWLECQRWMLKPTPKDKKE